LASLMEDLIDVLNQEEEQYQGLIELGKKKREVVIRADIKTLDEITATEQEVASNLQNLAKKRTRVLNDMATVLGRNPGDVTITMPSTGRDWNTVSGTSPVPGGISTNK
jgi:3-deoxy-D-manno-octulosonic-acid transferase